ncbi:MAG: hypothetical protein H6Q67_2386 [Firmicutes bacterium]|nr:hypothetical protein [Bacillota bacterium]
MTKKKWLQFYEAKLGHKFNPFPDSNFEFDEEKGFCIWKQDGDTIMAGDVTGDGRYWDNFLQEKTRELGCKKIKFGTYRKPFGFIRKYGYHIVGFIMEKEV